MKLILLFVLFNAFFVESKINSLLLPNTRRSVGQDVFDKITQEKLSNNVSIIILVQSNSKQIEKISYIRDVKLPVNKQMYVFTDIQVLNKPTYHKFDILVLLDGSFIDLNNITSSHERNVLIYGSITDAQVNLQKNVTLVSLINKNVMISNIRVDTSCKEPIILTKMIFDRTTKKVLQNRTAKNKNFNFCKIKLFYVSFTPSSSNITEEFRFIENQLPYKILLELFKNSQFTLDKIVIKTEKGYATKELKNNYIVQNMVNVKKNVLIYYDYKFFIEEEQDLSISLNKDRIVWLVLNHIHVEKPWITFLIIFFANIFLQSIMLALKIRKVQTFLKKINKHMNAENLILNFLSILFMISVPKQPKIQIFRIFFLLWVISASVLMLCYYFKIFESLTAITQYEIQNQQELLDKNISLYSFSEHYTDIAFPNRNKKQSIIVESFLKNTDYINNWNPNFENYLNNLIMSNKPCAVLLNESFMKRIMAKNQNTQYYVLKEPVLEFSLKIHGSDLNIFMQTIQKKVDNLISAGIIDKSIQDQNRGNIQSFPKLDKISMEHLYIIYIYMALMYFIAFCVFILEIWLS